MAIHVALFRGINVGGHQLVAMSRLRNLAEGLGFGDPRTLLQSGNLVFESEGRSTVEVEALLAAELQKQFAFSPECFVRTAAEWKALVAANPFPAAAHDDPSHLLVHFLKTPPAAANLRALQAAIAGREEVRAAGRQAYFIYPDGIGRSKLTPALIDAKLDQRGTGRNWNTVLKLAALAAA